MASDSNLIVATGFGPFRNHIVNSSWEAVKEMAKIGFGEDVQLKILELPVKYSEVEKMIKKIWTELKPQLSVHVGMSSSSKVVTLEQCGRNKGYTERDLSGAHPQDGCCLLDGPDIIEPSVNMKSVCKNISMPSVDIIYSRDAGRYLCEYAFFISLYYGNGRAVLIHVPQITRTLTAEKLGQALKIIIQEVLRHLKQAKEK
ncbi:pyroglutamyl-peptidase 1-like protein [Gastrophryne carolinensis]